MRKRKLKSYGKALLNLWWNRAYRFATYRHPSFMRRLLAKLTLFLLSFGFLIAETFRESGRNDAFRHGAALAYYSVFAFAPMIVVIISAIGLFLDARYAEDEILKQASLYIGPNGVVQLRDIIVNVQSKEARDVSLVATIIGVATLLFTSTAVFYAIQNSLNQFWEIKPRAARGIKRVVLNRLLAFAMVMLMGLLLLVSVIAEAVLSAVNRLFNQYLPDNIYQNILVAESGIYLLIFTLLFSLIFKYLPAAYIRWRDVLIGGLFTAFLFRVGQFLIGWYISNSNFAGTYGAAGTIMVILAWVYYSSQILFVGAEFTYVYATHFGRGVKKLYG